MLGLFCLITIVKSRSYYFNVRFAVRFHPFRYFCIGDLYGKHNIQNYAIETWISNPYRNNTLFRVSCYLVHNKIFCLLPPHTTNCKMNTIFFFFSFFVIFGSYSPSRYKCTEWFVCIKSMCATYTNVQIDWLYKIRFFFSQFQIYAAGIQNFC